MSGLDHGYAAAGQPTSCGTWVHDFNERESPAHIEDDVGHLSAEEAAARGLEFLPRTLPEALDALEADRVMAEALGPVIFSEFLKVKRSELAAYNLHVHPWERKMYLEAI